MSPRILDLCFNVSFSAPVILILEPLEEKWKKIYGLADMLVQSLPGRISGLYFLGNRRQYTITIPRDFQESMPGWFSEKRCEERQWELFMTGVDRNEITPFLKYLGKEFRLPEVEEWRGLLKVSEEIQKIGLQLKEVCKNKSAPSVDLWIEKGLFPLVEEGLLEMVLENGKERCLGRPYQGLLPNLFNPETVREVNWELCRRTVGFRVVREIRRGIQCKM